MESGKQLQIDLGTLFLWMALRLSPAWHCFWFLSILHPARRAYLGLLPPINPYINSGRQDTQTPSVATLVHNTSIQEAEIGDFYEFDASLT